MRLWQRLFLAFATLSGLALLVFVGWQQQNFRRGFLSYLDEVTVQRLEPARTRLTAAYAEHGNWNFLRSEPALLGEMIEPGPGAMRRLREDPRNFPTDAAAPEPPSAELDTDAFHRPPGKSAGSEINAARVGQEALASRWPGWPRGTPNLATTTRVAVRRTRTDHPT